MIGETTFDGLAALEPKLRQLEAEVMIRRDGGVSERDIHAGFSWRLSRLVGPGRVDGDDVLATREAYCVAAGHLFGR